MGAATLGLLDHVFLVATPLDDRLLRSQTQRSWGRARLRAEQVETFAPGWPGIPARWTSSAKSGVGTAVTAPATSGSR